MWNIIDNLDYEYYQTKYHVGPLLAKVMASKDFDDLTWEGIINPRLRYHDYSLFLDADIALDRIEEAIENKEKICVYGDYDCDGIIATSILVQAFKELGLEVGYHIPNRYTDGYGLNSERVEQMAKKGYSLIITVDNGIKAFEAVAKANDLGLDVIITDHHKCDDVLPEACAIIHTNISPCYPFKEICGGFVAYKLASALLGHHDKYLFTLAAIATVSDMMPLVDENRSLVKKAITFMAENSFPQIRALMNDKQVFSVGTIGFTIAPKINSFGRMPEIVNPNNLIKFFQKEAGDQLINTISVKAIEINKTRQELTKEQYEEVMRANRSPLQFLFSYEIPIHEGIVGLIAGKYTSQFRKPAFVMTYDANNDCYRGSARSVEEMPLNLIFDQLKDYFIQFGGHALAGGFSVAKDQVGDLKQAIQECLSNWDIAGADTGKEVILLQEDDLTFANIKELDRLEPYGNSFEKPLFFLEKARIDKVTPLKDNKHLKIELTYFAKNITAMIFNCGDIKERFDDLKEVSVIGELRINTFRNQDAINIWVRDIK